jgi:YidC/Oxa1 family membrane protein insertase
MTFALGSGSAQSYDMTWYIGPNEFERLRAHDLDMEDIVPFGWSIFGTINRWVVRPIFSFLSNFIGNKGIVILFLTLIVKSLVYPLTYKMLYSQSKMGALKPQMAKLREKYKDDQQKVQMETMKIYREYGVNPAGGCFPMVLQMPIWFALYRFFPASIEFRQASFLWANDLSSYDVFFRLPFEIPFLGDHLSLFTFLWAISMVVYTYYNSKIMDMNSINPMMKYMQYMMPLMFIFFFNSYASGLTCYLLFSNLMNITQTLVTKNYLINNDKILAELDANKKKPKKKGGFQQRLEKAMQEQQKIAGDRGKKK